MAAYCISLNFMIALSVLVECLEARNGDHSSLVFFFSPPLSVDATQESGRLGRLLNHSKTEANCATRLVCVQDTPRLILETVRQVTAGQEMLYDYGERSKDVIQFHQWLKS